MMTRLLTGLAAGFALGALFGVAFGALASVFEGGPPAWVGIVESWWWFAAAGAFMGLGWMRAVAYDHRSSRPVL
ncbi:MAG: hypothetical protein AAF170_16640 [Bacteroidota bacterium]